MVVRNVCERARSTVVDERQDTESHNRVSRARRRANGMIVFCLFFCCFLDLCCLAPAFQAPVPAVAALHSTRAKQCWARSPIQVRKSLTTKSHRQGPTLRCSRPGEDEWLVIPHEHSGTSPPESFERILPGLDNVQTTGNLRFHELLENLNEQLDLKTLLEFERQGHVAIKSLLDKSETELLQKNVLAAFEEHKFSAYVQKIRLLGDDTEDEELKQAAACLRSEEEARQLLEAWSEENDCPIPFLQVFNPHRGSSPEATALQSVVLAPRLGHIAADLLGVRGVRLYQTAVFHKAAGNGDTSWHADLATAPFDSNAMVTCWVALTPVESMDDSPLEFASGSHRDLALPYWYTEEGMEDPSGDPREYDVESHLPLHPGDSTWHHGWVYHAAPPNESGRDRVALALTFVSQDAHRLAAKRCRRRPEEEDSDSYREWIDEVPPGALAEHPLLPVTFSRPTASLEHSSAEDDEGIESLS